MKQKIIKQFGTLANACKELGLNYRTLRKVYEGKATQSTLDRIKGKGFSPKTFKPL